MSKSREKTIQQVLGRQPVHPFPARMAPGIVLDAIPSTKKRLRVLDPMAGSGTVLAVARAKGHSAIGVDIDPLSTLIASVWTTPISPLKIHRYAAAALRGARNIYRTLPQRDAYPKKADQETRRFVTYWFDPEARKQLASLATSISRTHDKNVRNVLWCAFSRLVITKQSGASLAMDLAHSRPHRAFKRSPIKPFKKFLSAAERVAQNCISNAAKRRGPTAKVLTGDARHLPLPDSSVDLVVTSPPYLNAIDYVRCNKFSLVWMGYNIADLRKLRRDAIGANVSARSSEECDAVTRRLRLSPPLEKREKAVLARYIRDMHQSMREITRVLAPNGHAVYVVGENSIHNTYVRNALILSLLGKTCGLTLLGRHVRLLPANRRYLPPPGPNSRGPLGRRIRREVILRFRNGGTHKESY